LDPGAIVLGLEIGLGKDYGYRSQLGLGKG